MIIRHGNIIYKKIRYCGINRNLVGREKVGAKKEKVKLNHKNLPGRGISRREKVIE